MKLAHLMVLGLFGLILLSGCAATAKRVLPEGDRIQTQLELSNESGQYLWIARVNSPLDVIHANQWRGVEEYGLCQFPLYSQKENWFAVEFYNTKANRAGFSKKEIRIRTRVYLSFAGTDKNQFAEILETHLYAKEPQSCVVYNDADWPVLFRTNQGHEELLLAPGAWKLIEAPGNEWLKYSWIWLDQVGDQYKEYAGRRWQGEVFIDTDKTDRVWQIDGQSTRVGATIRLYWQYRRP